MSPKSHQEAAFVKFDHPAATKVDHEVGERERVPPEPKDGQVPCPACRMPVTLTTAGNTPRHRDLFGNPCWHKPPPRTRADRGNHDPETNRRPITGRCQECDKAIPPGRRLCGRCSANRLT